MPALHLVNTAPEASDPTDAAKLAHLFAYECGFSPLPWMYRQFAQLLEEGFSFELLEEIISRTSRAPRPSWAYLAAIIAGCRIRHAYDLPSFLVMPRVQHWERELPL